MAPADQRFHANHAACHDIDLRLIMEHKFFADDGAAELILAEDDAAVLARDLHFFRIDVLVEDFFQFRNAKGLLQIADDGKPETLRELSGGLDDALARSADENDAGLALLLCKEPE